MTKIMNFVKTPRGRVESYKKVLDNGKVKVWSKLIWNSGFEPDMNRRFANAQAFLDSEVLRVSNKFAPQVSSMLIKSGILGTEVGSGEVAWIAPYAHFQYYLANRKTSQNINPNGGPFWFERAMAIYRKQIETAVIRRFG